MAYNVKFLKGTSTQLEGITRDLNTFYYVDDTDLFLGNIKLSNGADLAAAILRVAANEEDIKDLQDDIKALTGGETGSISGLIEEAVNAAKVELRKEISANTTAINTEKERAMGVEGGLETRLATVEGDYLKGSDKTELEGKITEVSTAVATEKSRAEGVESGLNTRIGAVESDIEYFFKDALKDEEGVQAYKDTLKEIQDYITSDAEAAGAMSASIKANADAIDAIEADYLKAADKTELQGKIDAKASTETVNGINGRLQTVEGKIDNKAETSVVTELSGKVTTLEGKVDVAKVSEAIAAGVTEAKGHTNTEIGKLSEVYDAKGAAGTAESNAKAYAKEYADGLAGNYDVKGAASSALTDAKAYADGLATNYDAAGAADTALESAKDYADSLATNYDAAGSANTALTNAKTYTNEEIAKLDKTYEKIGVAETKANAALDSAKAYADGLAVNYDAKGAAATAKSEAISAASSDATNKATTAENNAKAYVDTALTWGTIA
jgi:hypothetical protein